MGTFAGRSLIRFRSFGIRGVRLIGAALVSVYAVGCIINSRRILVYSSIPSCQSRILAIWTGIVSTAADPSSIVPIVQVGEAYTRGLRDENEHGDAHADGLPLALAHEMSLPDSASLATPSLASAVALSTQPGAHRTLTYVGPSSRRYSPGAWVIELASPIYQDSRRLFHPIDTGAEVFPMSCPDFRSGPSAARHSTSRCRSC
jgi:hypothetical protein